jgi:hypothetical protein
VGVCSYTCSPLILLDEEFAGVVDVSRVLAVIAYYLLATKLLVIPNTAEDTKRSKTILNMVGPEFALGESLMATQTLFVVAWLDYEISGKSNIFVGVGALLRGLVRVASFELQVVLLGSGQRFLRGVSRIRS